MCTISEKEEEQEEIINPTKTQEKIDYIVGVYRELSNREDVLPTPVRQEQEGPTKPVQKRTPEQGKQVGASRAKPTSEIDLLVKKIKVLEIK